MRGFVDERLNRQRAERIAHEPEIAADEILRLTRMHELGAVHRIDEEVAALTKVEPLQRIERELTALRVGAQIAGRRVVVRRDRAAGELHVMLQLDFSLLDMYAVCVVACCDCASAVAC